MKKAIVTGHSAGLGAALAGQLLESGVAVLGLSRRGNAELALRYPGLLTEAALDMGQPDALAQWLAGGALHAFVADAAQALLINNAGTVQPVGPPGMQGAQQVLASVALNVAAPLALADAFCAATATCRDRRIVHISSGAGSGAYPGWSVYCASKAALDHHARAVALDAVPALRICSLAPGIIDTAMQAQIRATTLERFPLRGEFDALKRDGALAAPADTARVLLAYVWGPRFGAEPVADLRDFS
ncbi:MAG TPA: SDR family oxidoreductase [Burkholderiaceae bacterium]